MKYDIEKRKAEAAERYNLRLKQVSPERAKTLKKEYEKLMQVLGLLADKTAPEAAEITGIHRTVIHGWGTKKFPKSFQLQATTDHKQVTARQKELHEMYDAQISSADGRSVNMQRDLADIDRAAGLMLDNHSYRESLRLMGARFRTVYDWIKRGNLPNSFTEKPPRLKTLDLRLESCDFAYILGVYQSKVDDINPERFSITTTDSYLETEVVQSFKALGALYSKTTIDYAGRTAKRIYYDSKSLMSLIKEITEDNTSIPKEFLQDQKMLINYLQGFFDARAAPNYSPDIIKSSHIRRLYPRITITKSGNIPLMSAINTALHFLGINSRYNPANNPDQISINETESIRKVIGYRLFRSKEKMQALKDTYKYWEETKEYDHNGKFQKQKDCIRLRKLAEKNIKTE